MALDLCALVGGNTGGPNCDGKRRAPKKIILGSKVFTTSDYPDEATFVAAIQAAINLDASSSSKLFPFPNIKAITPITEADTSGKLAFGATRRLRKGNPGYTYSLEIGHTQYQKLLAFDGKELPVITIDDAYQGWFYRNPTTGSISGEMAYVTVQGSGFEDGNAVETGVATVTIAYLDVDDFEKRSAYYGFQTISVGDFQGLKDVTLIEPQAAASNVYKVAMRIKTAKIGNDLNPWDEHGAAIAALTFTAGTGTNYGTALVITSVAADNTLKAFTVTFDSTAFTALAGGTKIKLTPPSVATLVAAGVTGVELFPIIVTK